MNLAWQKEPPLPGPLLHKHVEEREMKRRVVEGFNARSLTRENVSTPLSFRWSARWSRGFMREVCFGEISPCLSPPLCGSGGENREGVEIQIVRAIRARELGGLAGVTVEVAAR